MSFNKYYSDDTLKEAVEAGRHRQVVGGLWEEMGALQLDFLKRQGMTPSDTLLDIGCGTLRLGRLAVDYLEPGRYWGADRSALLLDTGYRQELTDAGRDRLPREQLIETENFDLSAVRAPVTFAMAQSVFSHLPLNHLRRCLTKLAEVMQPGGRFCATYFECPDDWPVTEPIQRGRKPGEIVSTDYKDPFHYRIDDLAWAAGQGPWRLERVGDWGHPRGQSMAVFVRDRD